MTLELVLSAMALSIALLNALPLDKIEDRVNELDAQVWKKG